jgi:hypothetical protein
MLRLEEQGTEGRRRHNRPNGPVALGSGVVEELGSQRDLFDVPDEVAYFNAASLSPALRSVREAGESALRRRARPWAIGEADWYADVERLRGLAGRLVGGDADGIALVPATSHGFAVAAANLPLEARQVGGAAPECLPDGAELVLRTDHLWALARFEAAEVCEACTARHG